MEEPKTINIKCGKCGADMRIHEPILARADTFAASSATLVPSWSLDERHCRECGAVAVPMFPQQIPYKWVSMEPPKQEDRPRIIKPGPLPVNFERKLRGA